MTRVLLRLVLAGALPALLVVVWWVASAGSTDVYWPPLRTILTAFPDVWTPERLRADVLPSVWRLAAGYALAAVAGVALGTVIGSHRRVRAVCEPVLEFLRAVPPPVLVPVIMLFAGIGDTMKVAVIASGCVWPVLLNTVEGVRAVDPVMAEAARSYGIRGVARLRSLVLPSASPQIFAGLRQALSIGIILMVISEMFAASNGLGFTIVQFQRGFAIPDMWTGILLLGMLGVVLSVLFRLVERRVLGWYHALPCRIPGLRATPHADSRQETAMRFAAYEYRNRRHVAVVSEDGTLHPLPGVSSLTGLLAEGGGLPELLDAGSATLDVPAGPHVRDVRLLAPLQPPTVRDFVTFEEHVEGVRRSVDGAAGVPERWYAAPTFYFGNPYAMYGPHDDIPMPPGSSVLDFELEVAAVIGKEGRDLTPEQARDHIVGYTVFNDWSARDLQSAEMKVGLGPCKGKDTATTLGPYLVTADELAKYRDADGFLRLALTAEINGEVVGKDLLSNMSWTFEEMAAYASRGTVVRPGDVLGSGTCGNGGCLAELWGVRGEQSPPPLKPGDTVTLTVEGIGSVSNTVVAGPDPMTVPVARRRSRERP